MKKILLVLFLILCIEKANAQEITKVIAQVSTTYKDNWRDTIIQNGSIITSNLLPIGHFYFYFRWSGITVNPNYPWVNVDLYDAVTNKILSSDRISIKPNSPTDSATIFCQTSAINTNIGSTSKFYLRLTYSDPFNDQKLNFDEKSNLWQISFIDSPDKIYNNKICCSKIVTLPYLPSEQITQDPAAGTGVQTISYLPMKFIWEVKTQGTDFHAIPGATNESYFPQKQSKDTYYRRVALAYKGSKEVSHDISNTVSFARAEACTRPQTTNNAICGDQGFFNLVDGDVIYPTRIFGSYISWPVQGASNRSQGYQYMSSRDGYTWNELSGIEELHGPAAIPKDYTLNPTIFKINNGVIQHIYIQRRYYERYDSWDCGWPIPLYPCGIKWHLKSISNVVTFTLTSLSPPKPVVDSITNETGYDNASCSYAAQTMVFSVPRVDNNETYNWEIPVGWIAYTDLQGPYANSITISTNSGGGNYAKGGNVCLTIKQPGQINSMCRNIQGSDPFTVKLPTVLTGCEGSEVIVTPVVFKNNVAQSNSDYNFKWEAYQSPNIECIPQNTKYNSSCRQLKINIGNVYQNPIQPIKVIALNNHGCAASATTTLTTSPGLQMGILASFDDPKAASTSNVALDESNNYIYFTAADGVIQRVTFDDNVNIWGYAALKDVNTNAPIKSTGSVAFYKGVYDQLYYVNAGNIYYAANMINPTTWTNFNKVAIATGVDKRIKIYGNNIYYIDGTNRVFYNSLINPSTPVLVGNVPINYSQDMFTVEDGILAYADQSNNIVAFDAMTGAALPINMSANLKAVSYNSAISVYNKNIYFIGGGSTTGKLRILQKSSTSSSYTAYQDVSNQLAGPLTINKQTGTIYAKAYDIPGKQIYYLNGQWNELPIKNYLQGSPIQSSMVYGNGHAFYIGTNGLISNTFYIAPCVPNVLRTSGNLNINEGDPINDPIPVTRESLNVLNIYPNPAKNSVHVNFTTEQASNIQIKIVDLTGKEETLINKNVEQGINDIALPITEYAAGAYLIQLYIEGELSATAKLITY